MPRSESIILSCDDFIPISRLEILSLLWCGSCSFLINTDLLTGVSIWVFFILANSVSNGSETYLASTQCNFTLDFNYVDTFFHQPDQSTQDLQYNAIVFSASGLSNSLYYLEMSADLTNTSYFTFDYAIYTADIPDNATSTSTASSASEIVGPSASSTRASGSAEDRPHSLSSSRKLGTIIACVVVVVLIGASILGMRRFGQKQKASIKPAIAFFHQEPSHGNGDDVAISNSHILSEFITGLVPVRREYHSLHPHSVTNRDEVRAERQREIDQRLQIVQQEMHNFNSRQNTMRRRPGSLLSEARGQAETEQELEGVREQMRRFRTQIEHLRMDRSSDWAQGLSDEPPPAYY
ncbi:hypothetical protein F5887DRAFT_1075889 [Amanita rubescens]|nr:hypothetical protein F5887DRAFT_1075889 [Amanita rubescens]